jgi:hypothetical protein
MVSTIGTNVCEARSRGGIWLNLALFQLVFFLADKRFFCASLASNQEEATRARLLVMGQRSPSLYKRNEGRQDRMEELI